MGAVATFNYELWTSIYPELSNVTLAQAQNYWNLATLRWRNDGGGPVCDVDQQAAILGMLTSHIAFLAVGSNNGPSAGSQGMAGRISSATQGSVSISTELPAGIDSYLAQSRYGVDYWNTTRAYRTFRYMPRAGRAFPW